MSLERKNSPQYLAGIDLELDAKAVSSSGEFEGWASTFDNVDRGRDVVKAGAFDESLRDRPANKVKMLRAHDPNWLVGHWKEMRTTSEGLLVKGQLLLDTVAGKECYELMKVGALDAMSIGYKVLKDSFDRQNSVRFLEKVALFEVSLVTFGMNEQAVVSAVKGEEITTIRQFETFLRDVAGFSHGRAKHVASHGFKESDPREEAGSANADLMDRLNRLAENLQASA